MLGYGLRMSDDERLVQNEPEVMEGEDDLPRHPASHRDPFVPEPAARDGERRAWATMRLATLAVAILIVVIVVWAIVAN
jgi:hypothetical protein